MLGIKSILSSQYHYMLWTQKRVISSELDMTSIWVWYQVLSHDILQTLILITI